MKKFVMLKGTYPVDNIVSGDHVSLGTEACVVHAGEIAEVFTDKSAVRRIVVEGDERVADLLDYLANYDYMGDIKFAKGDLVYAPGAQEAVVERVYSESEIQVVTVDGLSHKYTSRSLEPVSMCEIVRDHQCELKRIRGKL